MLSLSSITTYNKMKIMKDWGVFRIAYTYITFKISDTLTTFFSLLKLNFETFLYLIEEHIIEKLRF